MKGKYDVRDDIEYRVQSWQRYQTVVEAEMNRRNFLKQPVPSTINPEHLYAPTRVRVLRTALGSYTSTNVCGSRRHTKALLHYVT